MNVLWSDWQHLATAANNFTSFIRPVNQCCTITTTLTFDFIVQVCLMTRWACAWHTLSLDILLLQWWRQSGYKPRPPLYEVEVGPSIRKPHPHHAQPHSYAPYTHAIGVKVRLLAVSAEAELELRVGQLLFVCVSLLLSSCGREKTKKRDDWNRVLLLV